MERPMRRFYLRLAARLGRTVEELLASISSAELTEQYAFYILEPYGQEWLQTAQQCAMAGNAAGGKKGGGKFNTDDFMPTKPPKRKQSPSEILNIFKVFAAKQNANVNNRLIERQPGDVNGGVHRGG
jgi:hypothetical protein